MRVYLSRIVAVLLTIAILSDPRLAVVAYANPIYPSPAAQLFDDQALSARVLLSRMAAVLPRHEFTSRWKEAYAGDVEGVLSSAALEGTQASSDSLFSPQAPGFWRAAGLMAFVLAVSYILLPGAAESLQSLQATAALSPIVASVVNVAVWALNDWVFSVILPLAALSLSGLMLRQLLQGQAPFRWVSARFEAWDLAANRIRTSPAGASWSTRVGRQTAAFFFHAPIELPLLVYRFGFQPIVRLMQISWTDTLPAAANPIERTYFRLHKLHWMLAILTLPFMASASLLGKRLLLKLYSTTGQMALTGAFASLFAVAAYMIGAEPGTSLLWLSALKSWNLLSFLFGADLSWLLPQDAMLSHAIYQFFSFFGLLSAVLLSWMMMWPARIKHQWAATAEGPEGWRRVRTVFWKSLYIQPVRDDKGTLISEINAFASWAQFKTFARLILLSGKSIQAVGIEIAFLKWSTAWSAPMHQVTLLVEDKLMSGGDDVLAKALGPHGVTTGDLTRYLPGTAGLSDQEIARIHEEEAIIEHLKNQGDAQWLAAREGSTLNRALNGRTHSLAYDVADAAFKPVEVLVSVLEGPRATAAELPSAPKSQPVPQASGAGSGGSGGGGPGSGGPKEARVPAPSRNAVAPAPVPAAPAAISAPPEAWIKEANDDLREEWTLEKALQDQNAKTPRVQKFFGAYGEKGTFVTGSRVGPAFRFGLQTTIATPWGPMKAHADRADAIKANEDMIERLKKAAQDREIVLALKLQAQAEEEVADALQSAAQLADAVSAPTPATGSGEPLGGWQKALADVRGSLAVQESQSRTAAQKARLEIDRLAHRPLSKTPSTESPRPANARELQGFLHPTFVAPTNAAGSPAAQGPVLDPNAQEAVVAVAKTVERAQMLVEGNARSWAAKYLPIVPARVTLRAAAVFDVRDIRDGAFSVKSVFSKYALFGVFNPEFDKVEKINWSQEPTSMKSKLEDFEKARTATFHHMVAAMHQLRDAHEQVTLAEARMKAAKASAVEPSRPTSQAVEDLAHYTDAARDHANAKAQMTLAAVQLVSEGFSDDDIQAIQEIQSTAGENASDADRDISIDQQMDQKAAEQTQRLYVQIAKTLAAKDRRFDADVKKAQQRSHREFAELMTRLQNAAEEPLVLKPQEIQTTDLPPPVETNAPSAFHIDGPQASPFSVGVTTTKTQSNVDALTVLDGHGTEAPSATVNTFINSDIVFNGKSVSKVQSNYNNAYAAARTVGEQRSAADLAANAGERTASLASIDAQLTDLIQEHALLKDASPTSQETKTIEQEIARLKADRKQLQLQARSSPPPPPAPDHVPTSYDLAKSKLNLASAAAKLKGKDLFHLPIAGAVQVGKNELRDGKNFLFNPWELNIEPALRPVVNVIVKLYSNPHPERALDILQRDELLKAEERMRAVKESFAAAEAKLTRARSLEAMAKTASVEAESARQSQYAGAHVPEDRRLEASRAALSAHRHWIQAREGLAHAQAEFDRWKSEKDGYDEALRDDHKPSDPVEWALWNHLHDPPSKPLAERRREWMMDKTKLSKGDARIFSGLAYGPAAVLARDSTGDAPLVTRLFGGRASFTVNPSAAPSQAKEVAKAATVAAKDLDDAAHEEQERRLRQPVIEVQLALSGETAKQADRLETLLKERTSQRTGEFPPEPDEQAILRARIQHLRIKAEELKNQALDAAAQAGINADDLAELSLSDSNQAHRVQYPEQMADQILKNAEKATTAHTYTRWLGVFPALNVQGFWAKGNNGLWSWGYSAETSPGSLRSPFADPRAGRLSENLRKHERADHRTELVRHLQNLSDGIRAAKETVEVAAQDWRRAESLESAFEWDAKNDVIDMADVLEPAQRSASALERYGSALTVLRKAERELMLLVGHDPDDEEDKPIAGLETVEIRIPPSPPAPAFISADGAESLRTARAFSRVVIGYVEPATQRALQTTVIKPLGLNRADAPAAVRLAKSADRYPAGAEAPPTQKREAFEKNLSFAVAVAQDQSRKQVSAADILRDPKKIDAVAAVTAEIRDVGIHAVQAKLTASKETWLAWVDAKLKAGTLASTLAAMPKEGPTASPAAHVATGAAETALHHTIQVDSRRLWTVGHIVLWVREQWPEYSKALQGPLFDTPSEKGAATRLWEAVQSQRRREGDPRAGQSYLRIRSGDTLDIRDLLATLSSTSSSAPSHGAVLWNDAAALGALLPMEERLDILAPHFAEGELISQTNTFIRFAEKMMNIASHSSPSDKMKLVKGAMVYIKTTPALTMLDRVIDDPVVLEAARRALGIRHMEETYDKSLEERINMLWPALNLALQRAVAREPRHKTSDLPAAALRRPKTIASAA